MKKKLIILTISIILLAGTFTAGIKASTWLTYTGDVEQSQNDLNEIMDILEQVHEEKITAEEALADLEELNPPGLVKQIKRLEEDNAALNDYIRHLENELTRANEEAEGMNQSTSDALNQAREYVE